MFLVTTVTVMNHICYNYITVMIDADSQRRVKKARKPKKEKSKGEENFWKLFKKNVTTTY